MKLKSIIKSNCLSITAPNVRDIKGVEGSIEINPLLKNIPTTHEEMEELRRRIYTNELAPFFLVSKDGRVANIIIDFEIDRNYSTYYQNVEKIVEKVKDKKHNIYLGGPVSIVHFLEVYSRKMAILFIFVIIIIGLIHYEAFRTIQAIIFPLLTGILSVIWGIGILGFFKIPIDVWNSMTPILILSVAAGHAVQILKRYYEEYDRLGNNRLAIIESVSSVGSVMLLTGIITVIGFLSLIVFDIKTIRVFGLFTAVGILSALILEMTFIPAIRFILPPSKNIFILKKKKKGILEKCLENGIRLILGKPIIIIVTFFLILSISLLGATKIKVNNSFIGAFSKKEKVRLDDDFINKHFAGTSIMNILIEGEKTDSLKSPEVLDAMSRLQRNLEKRSEVGKTISLANFIKRMNMAMNGDEKNYYSIPKDKNLISQYLFLLSSEDLNFIVDQEYRHGVIRIFTKIDTATFSNEIFAEAKDIASTLFRNTDVTVEVAGGSLGTLRALNDNVVHEKIQNIWQVTTVIFLIASLALRSFVGGIYVITPSLVAIVINFGLMGITGIWLSLSTAAVSALTISIGSDYAFYFIFRYKEEIRKLKDHNLAIRETMLTAGKAIFFVSSAIAAGFVILLFSGLIYHKHLGGLVALNMINSSLGTVTLLPAMITIFKPKFLYEKMKPLG
ncbi:MAG: MMPL family transporter [bacterium]